MYHARERKTYFVNFVMKPLGGGGGGAQEDFLCSLTGCGTVLSYRCLSYKGGGVGGGGMVRRDLRCVYINRRAHLPLFLRNDTYTSKRDEGCSDLPVK